MFGANTCPGNPFSMFMSWPEPSVPGKIGASCAVQSCSAWQLMQSVALLTRYWPRANRAGVLSNFRAVNVRARGPMNGLQPIVKVMPTASTTASTTTVHANSFPSFFIESLRLRTRLRELRLSDDRDDAGCGKFVLLLTLDLRLHYA